MSERPLDLTPIESMALTVALAQLRRGERLPPNTASVCVLALARLSGRLEQTGDRWFECPRCERTTRWTDGTEVQMGDERDEFWCQVCGRESPLETCREAADVERPKIEISEWEQIDELKPGGAG